MRIAFLVPTLGPGGAERVASLLTSSWAEHAHGVTLISFEDPQQEPFYNLHGSVSVRQLGLVNRSRGMLHRLATNVRRVFRLRSLLRDLRPDVVVAFTIDANVIALWASRGLTIPVVISERNQPDRPDLVPLHRFARHLTYHWAAALVVQTEAVALWARQRFSVPIHIIPNPVVLVDRSAGDSGPTEPRSLSHCLLAVGRLSKQKGFDLLLQSFSILAPSYPNWHLVIHGEGPERAILERAIRQLSLSGKVVLPGVRKDLSEAFASASLFVLPSRFEGFPNALLEALAWGLPVIATACPGGTVEILGNGTYGLLVPVGDIVSMTGALNRMMASDELRTAYAQRAKLAVSRYDVGIVSKRWLGLLASLI
jgi:GalNAc-alpha-(1->4)-GalNAc-alpha-(1->3)-diNAcBac-PP-undecaprenol alpha-1,4-N-acetyl-D-galactosaminyltransferase